MKDPRHMSEDEYRQWRIDATRRRAEQISNGTLPEAMRPSAGLDRVLGPIDLTDRRSPRAKRRVARAGKDA